MFRLHAVTVLLIIGLSCAKDYEGELRKLWSGNSDSNSATQNVRESRMPYIYRKYAFRPRAIPLMREQKEENSVKVPSTIFPGNDIPTEKTVPVRFNIQEIPLIRNEEFEKRSLDVDEPIIEKPADFSEATASRRSISYIFGEDDEEEDLEEEDGEYEEEDTGSVKEGDSQRKKNKLKLKKPKKLKKYMLPLLLAYKMKYFALVPVMISGLILLIGATGLAGFFFALFAAVMGLQKGGY